MPRAAVKTISLLLAGTPALPLLAVPTPGARFRVLP